MGLAILAFSPLVVISARHSPNSAAASARPVTVAAVVERTGRQLPVHDPELRYATTNPTPAPTPVATPRPTAAPVHVVAPTPRATLRPRPVTTPPPAPPAPAGSIQAIIQAAANQWGVSYPWMLKIAQCESGLNPRAYNPAGPYYGLYQFLMSTFTANGGTNIWDPVQQAQITAKMLAHGQAHQWGCA